MLSTTCFKGKTPGYMGWGKGWPMYVRGHWCSFSWCSVNPCNLMFYLIAISTVVIYKLPSRPDKHCHPSCTNQIRLVNSIFKLFFVGKTFLNFKKSPFPHKIQNLNMFRSPNLWLCVKIWERICPHSQQPVKKYFLWHFKIFYIWSDIKT